MNQPSATATYQELLAAAPKGDFFRSRREEDGNELHGHIEEVRVEFDEHDGVRKNRILIFLDKASKSNGEAWRPTEHKLIIRQLPTSFNLTESGDRLVFSYEDKFGSFSISNYRTPLLEGRAP